MLLLFVTALQVIRRLPSPNSPQDRCLAYARDEYSPIKYVFFLEVTCKVNAQPDSRASFGHELARSAYSTERNLHNQNALQVSCRSVQVSDDIQLPYMHTESFQVAAFDCVCAIVRICSIWQCGIAIAHAEILRGRRRFGAW